MTLWVWIGVLANDHFFRLSAPTRRPHFGPLKTTNFRVFNGLPLFGDNEVLATLGADNSEK